MPGPPRRFAVADLTSTVTGSVAVIATAMGGVLLIVTVAVSAAVVVRAAAGIGIAVGAVVVKTAVGIGVAAGALVAVGGDVRAAVMTAVAWAAEGKNVRVPVTAVPGSLATATVAVMAEPTAARVAVAGATVGDAMAVAVLAGRNASEIAVALCGTAVGSDVLVAATAGLVLVAVGEGTALPWSAAKSSSVGTATQPARKSNRQDERRMAI
jgi:hypothetical protein